MPNRKKKKKKKQKKLLKLKLKVKQLKPGKVEKLPSQNLQKSRQRSLR